ncbi:MAG: hypothetical protein ACLP3B_22315 [Syntrophobacteraceae bacterium]
MYDPEEDFPERNGDRLYSDLIGIVSPKGPINDPALAKNCLNTIRDLSKHVSNVITASRVDDFHLDCDALAVLSTLVDSIHIGAGHVLEWADALPRPEIKEDPHA